MPVCSWDHPVIGRLNRGFQADVGKVGDRQNVHDAPKLARRFAFQLMPNQTANRASRAVAAHDEPCADGLFRSAAAQRGDDGMIARAFDPQINQFAPIVGRQTTRRFRHRLQIEVMDARLAENDVRHLRKIVFNVLDPVGARKTAEAVGPPECRLVHPIGFARRLVGETERLEHLHRTTGDPVGAAESQRAFGLLDQTNGDIGESRELRGERKPRRPAAHDQNVDSALVRRRRLRRDGRVAGAKSIQVILQNAPPRRAPSSGVIFCG